MGETEYQYGKQVWSQQKRTRKPKIKEAGFYWINDKNKKYSEALDKQTAFLKRFKASKLSLKTPKNQGMSAIVN